MRVIKAFINAFFVSNPWRPHARDARGAERPIVNLRGYWYRRYQSGAIPKPAFRRIRKNLIRAGFTRGLGAGTPVLLLIMTSQLLLALWHGSRFGFDLLEFILLLNAFIMGFFAAIRRYRIPTVDGQVLASVLLGENICPVCAFTLSEIPKNAQGVVVCPECGSHWALPITQ